MSDAPPSIADVLLDLPLVDAEGRPEGMICVRRSGVPEARREEADRFVADNGGLTGHIPLIQVIGGTTPQGAPPGETFYAIPIAAFVTE